jgi:hypothetical protein
MPTKPYPYFIPQVPIPQPTYQPVPQPQIVPVAVPQSTGLDPDLASRLDHIESLLKVLLLAASGPGLPTTDIATTFNGSNIATTDRYLELYTNRNNRMVSLKVTAEFIVPGSQVVLALEPNFNGNIDLLSSNGKTVSDTIILPANATLWINTNDTAFSLNGSIFRVLLFDGLGYAAKV